MKRCFSLFLCLILLFSIFPISALAEEPASEEGKEYSETEPEPVVNEVQETEDNEDDSEDDPVTDETDYEDTVSIHISEGSITLDAWETCSLYTDCSPESVIWVSEDPDIASVDEDGTVTGYSRGETIVTAIAELDDGTTASDECFVTVLSDGYYASSAEELQSNHPYNAGESAIWEYTLPGAEELMVEFDGQTRLGSGAFLILADGDGEEFADEDGNRMSFADTQLAGRSLRLPGDTFRIYLYIDEDAESDWGFAVSEVGEYTEHTEEENSDESGDSEESDEAEKTEETEPSEETEKEEDEAEPKMLVAVKREEVIPAAESFGPARTPDLRSSKMLMASASPNAAQLTGATEEDSSSALRNDPLRAVPPTAEITLLPSKLTMDAGTEQALIATVTIQNETDLDKISIDWSADSDKLTITNKNQTKNTASNTLTGTATVLAGDIHTDIPVTVTAAVMFTADDTTPPAAVNTAEGGKAEATSEVSVLNDAVVVDDWHDLDSDHDYSPDTHCYWQYTVPDPKVKSVTLTFDTLTEAVSPRDYIRVTDGAGRPAGVYTGKLLSGQSVTVDSRIVRIYLDSDVNSPGAWGFKVTNLTTVSGDDAPRYSVRYYANGGVDAPKDQPAHELPLTLSESAPAREHYDFKGWATDRDSGATYQPGETIETIDPAVLVGSRLDLFAVWERIPTYNDSNRGVSTATYSGPVDNSNAEPKTTPANPILVERPETEYDKDVLHIRTVDDLLAFAENCSLDTWSDRLPVVLDNDLSLSGVDFWAVPIFNGCFDGRDHTIYDVTITDAMAPCGFFLELGLNATVKNLNVVGNVLPGGENNMTGGLVGLNRGCLLNCSFSGTVAGTAETGGIAGRNEATGIISGCRSTATVSGMNVTGGVAGHNLGAIVGCESKSFVNISSVDPALNIQTLDTSSILNFIQSISSDTVGVTTDTGGIAGFNEGFIETCISRETVGYQHLGYNVGGIAGRSDGYISTCLNEAEVYGRRDVGGILGQAEPYIELRESNSIVAGLSYRVYALRRSIEAAANDAEVLGDDIAGELSSLSLYVNPLEAALLAFDIYDPTPEALENIREALRNMVSGVSGELESMGASVDEGSSVLSDDLTSISDNLNALSGTAIQSAELISSSRGNAVLEDISVSEAESELTLGKVSGCTNRGEIRGDNNVGGIVGCMSIENRLDPESDLTNTDFLTRRQNRYRIVVAECLNDGPVTAKKECAGGIAGKTDIGYLTRSVAYSSVTVEDGAYAGGICGLLYGTVGSCVAKCSLTGSRYVGGIVGNGWTPSDPEDRSSLVTNCYTLVEILDRPQFSGAVSGGGEGSYTENFFVPSGYAGLNRLSIQGQAEPVLFSVFASLNGLPEESKHFTLRFLVEGELVKEVPFEYGASFTKSVFPEVPTKDGAYAVWDRTDLTDLRFDTVVNATYRRSETALKSDLKREDGRAVGYVVGQFQQGDTLTAEILPIADTAIENFRLSWRQAAIKQLRSMIHGDPDYDIPVAVLEHAVFRFPDDGTGLHTLRYLSPNGETGNIRVYQKMNGRWEQLKPTVFGSYLSVLTTETEPELCLVQTMQSWWILLWVIGAIVVLILLILFLRAISKKRKSRKNAPPASPTGEGDDAEPDEVSAAAAPSSDTRREQSPDRSDPSAASLPEGDGAAAPERGKKRSRRPLLIVLIVLLVILVLALAVLLPSGRLQAGITGLRVLRDFYDQEADIDTEIRLVLGEETLSLDSTVHRLHEKDRVVACADQYGIPLYISGGDIYLENGRAFRILNQTLDRKDLLRLAFEAFRHGSLNVSREGDTTRMTTELGSGAISKTLRGLLSEEIDGILTVSRLSLSLAVTDGSLSEFVLESDGMLTDGKNFEIAVSLRPQPLSERPDIPQAVWDAINSGTRSPELLTDDFLALLAAWIRCDNAPRASADVTVNVEAPLLNLNETYAYFRENVDGTDIHAVSSRLFSVYFTDSAACTANGTPLGDADSRLKNSAALIAVARELCLDGSFSCEKIGSGRVYTLTVPAESMEGIVTRVLPELSGLHLRYTDCVLTVTVRDDALSAIELRAGATLKVVARELDAGAGVIVRFTEPEEHSIPARVLETLLPA
ncbi:MAG: InlB B-repeat-containing protein [Oscillospiraceae bacterium]|nr:InlB B-repeat-containing protein [Oscillospiraceae bacterium]